KRRGSALHSRRLGVSLPGGAVMVSRSLLVFGALATVLGCGSSANEATGSQGSGASAATSGPSGSTGSGNAGTGGVGGDVTTYETGMGPINVPSGQESTQCIYVRLENPEAVFFRRFRATLS